MVAAPLDLVDDVRSVLTELATQDVPVMNDRLKLHDDLGIDDDLGRKALAAPFQRIARRFRDEAIVTRPECSNLETVKDCVSLVAAKAGFEFQGEK